MYTYIASIMTDTRRPILNNMY